MLNNYFRHRITFAGLPAAKLNGGIDFVTIDPAPMTDPSPIVTPVKTMTLDANQTLSSIRIGACFAGILPTS